MKPPAKARRIQVGRGLCQYGRSPVVDNYGTSAKVSDSSSGEGRFCWLFIDPIGKETAGIHLTHKQAEELRRRLASFIETWFPEYKT